MNAALVYDARMAGYRFGGGHPMLSERFTLAVDLMEAWGLIGEGPQQARRVSPAPASDEDLLRVHSEDYIAVVKNERAGAFADDSHGLGWGDTPRFPHMHEVSALIVGGTCKALDGVLDDEWTRAFNPAGGLHHAHRDRAAGFCVYNDCAVAISRASAAKPDVRVAYVDIDAHHGDGVQEAFYSRRDVLTISVHESGRYLYPGTGVARDIGTGEGVGAALNVPLPPHAGPAEYELVFERIIEPALRVFGPDVIVAQLGADTHANDPLAHLALTVRGHASLVSHLAAYADELCEGRLVATGGGGYEAFSATPRMWASAMAILLGREVPEKLPESWRERSAEAAARAGFAPMMALCTFDEQAVPRAGQSSEDALGLTQRVIDEVRAASPLLARSS